MQKRALKGAGKPKRRPSGRQPLVRTYQTRSDDIEGKHGGCKEFDTFEDAYTAWKEDPSIWKISITYLGLTLRSERWKVRHKQLIDFSKEMNEFQALRNDQEEKFLGRLNRKYIDAKENDVFWIHQDLLSPNFKKNEKIHVYSHEYRDHLNRLESIHAILTDEEFYKRHRS